MTTSTELRFVLDTNQIVGAGSRWLDDRSNAGSQNQHLFLLRYVASAQTGLYSDEIIEEYLEKMLDRGHPEERARRMISYLLGAFQAVEILTTHPPVSPVDPDDEIFLLCALDGEADYLVSEDSDLLDLRHEYTLPMILRCADTLVTLALNTT